MMRKTAFEAIVERLENPDNAVLYTKLKANHDKNGIDILWYVCRMKNMLSAIDSEKNFSSKKIYEDSFDASIREVVKMLDSEGWK